MMFAKLVVSFSRISLINFSFYYIIQVCIFNVINSPCATMTLHFPIEFSIYFQGWKENIVEFDSVFNKSDTTISWGSPDIVSMFKRGNITIILHCYLYYFNFNAWYILESNTGNIHVYSYDSDLQDFSGKNHSSIILSEWVFNKVKLFFKDSFSDESIRMKLMKKKLLLFLHFLGTDVSGHIDKPHSK